MAKNALSPEIVEGFKELDAVSVADVCVGLGLRCVAQGLKPLRSGMTLCGQAITVREIPSRQWSTWAMDEVHTSQLVELASPGDVIVIDAGGRTDVAPWGANVTLQASKKGVAGTIIDGACRDSLDTIQAGYAFFARGLTLQHSHGSFYSTCLNSEPVQIGAPPSPVLVAPGDLVMADDDGVVVVPAERAEEILSLARERRELDLLAHEFNRQGRSKSDPEVAKGAARVRELEGLK